MNPRKNEFAQQNAWHPQRQAQVNAQAKPSAAQAKVAGSAFRNQLGDGTGYRPQPGPGVAQFKRANAAPNRQPPTAPPAYRPQSVPRACQTKITSGQLSRSVSASQLGRQPEPGKVAQAKMVTAAQSPRLFKPPPSHSPSATPTVLQTRDSRSRSMASRPSKPSSSQPLPERGKTRIAQNQTRRLSASLGSHIVPMSSPFRPTIQPKFVPKATLAAHIETGNSTKVGNGYQYSLFYKKATTYPHIHATEVMEVTIGKGRKKKPNYMILAFHHSDGAGTTFHWKENAAGTGFVPKTNGAVPSKAQKDMATDFVGLFGGTLV